MDLVTSIAVLWFLGGLVVALSIRLHGRRANATADVFAGESPSTDVINIARIRVAGVGGLGLVAMALTVAWGVPRIGQTLGIGFVLGAICGVVLILRSRGNGPMPSSGRRSGANTTLSIDDPLRSPHQEMDESPKRPRTECVSTVPTSSISPA
jgi:hypothetical protein